MQTLFIADNDITVIEEITHILDWDSLGFSFCGEASDGEDALAQILSLQPDLVILDTDIPKISGTEVLLHARKAGFIGKCIIVSAQCSFQYAKEAINGNASFYLNKPIDKDELYQAVCEIRDTFTDDTAMLLECRYFYTPRQHALDSNTLKEKTIVPPHYDFLPLDENLFTGFVNCLVDYLESFNRKMIVKSLSEFEVRLSESFHDVRRLKLVLMDLYLQIKEEINKKYASFEIPFETNAFALEYINSRNFLYEIIDFFMEQFDMIIIAIRNPSLDNVVDDLLFYIDHNYTKNIKLETVAQLFGYNNAYLGKIFHKKMGQSFNSYLDYKRIEYSKQLILEDKLKIYEIAREAGYKNVDYFHIKFKKYVGKSPSEYRKQITD